MLDSCFRLVIPSMTLYHTNRVIQTQLRLPWVPTQVDWIACCLCCFHRVHFKRTPSHFPASPESQHSSLQGYCSTGNGTHRTVTVQEPGTCHLVHKSDFNCMSTLSSSDVITNTSTSSISVYQTHVPSMG